MKRIEYNSENVYTQSNRDITIEDLTKAQAINGIIQDAYFFSVDGDHQVYRTEFNPREIEKNTQGLYVFVRSRGTFGDSASLSINGLENITQFLIDTRSLGKDLSTLGSKKVRQYISDGIELIGIGVPLEQNE